MSANLILILGVIAYLVGLILVANRLDGMLFKRRAPRLTYPYTYDDTLTVEAEVNSQTRPLQMALMFMLFPVILLVGFNALAILLTTLVPADANLSDVALDLSFPSALGIAFMGALASIISYAVLTSERFRQQIAHWLGAQASFNPDSFVHRTALILAVLLLAYSTIEIIAAGGVQGLAESLETQEIGLFDAVANLFIMPVAALLGVGFLMRRNAHETAERLDLRMPTSDDLIWGLGTALGCLIFIFIVAGLMSLVLSPEIMAEQGAASEQIARAFSGSLLLAFLAALSAAVGEEILFRGALQPVFGLIPTTLFFALLHSQYTFTPAAAMIVVVGGAMGWLKNRQSTTAAIIAHFVYNFVQLGLAYLYLRFEEAGLLPDTVESMLALPSILMHLWM